MRTATNWHRTQLDGKTVLWIDGTEGTGPRICSVHDPESTLPAIRITTPGKLLTLDGEAPGLTVYGTHKWDRPSVDAFGDWSPLYAYLVEGILEGRGITDGATNSSAAGAALGSVTSKRKARAVRANGKLGGRPRANLPCIHCDEPTRERDASRRPDCGRHK